MPETRRVAGTKNSGGETTALAPETILQSRYKVQGVLGGGGMGTVYQARDLNFPDAVRLVAVKEMHNSARNSALRDSARKIFDREANILATLSHPAIPKIFDFFSTNDRAYLVMEYINGRDIELLLTKTKDFLPIEKVVEWAIDLCDVLQYLHSHEPDPIIFRDMKPANLMIDNRGKIRLIDFGIAKTFVSGVKHTMIGTEGYSAPEQYKGDVTIKSDIYSLGATLHHILTRQDPRMAPPFSFQDRPIQQYNPQVPDWLVDIVDRMLRFEPGGRYQSCAELKSEFESAAIRPHLSVNQNLPDGQDTGYMPDSNIGELQPRWTFKTEDEIRSSPVAYRGLGFIGSYDTNMWAVDLESGTMVWKYATEGGIASSPVIDSSNKQILFGSDDHTFYSLEFNTGKLQWTLRTDGPVRGTARVAHDHVFVGSDDGYLYAISAYNGRLLWKHDFELPVRCRPFVTNDLVIVGSDAGNLVALELSGNRKWTYPARRSIISGPYVDRATELCFVGGTDNFLYALDAPTGYNAWRFRTTGPVISSPTVYEDLVYFGSADGNIYAVNTETGKEKWRFETEKPVVSSPLVHDDILYIGGTDARFYCLNARTGSELWRYHTSGPITSTAFIINDLILFGSTDQTFYALPLVK